MTLKELRSRHSVRSFSLNKIPEDLRKQLNAEITMINSHEAGLNFQLCFDDDDPFRGFTRSYGFFKNARNYLACVIDSSFPNAAERAGYFAEQFVMKCVLMGLGTCFIGGTYSSSHVNAAMRVYEKLPFIVTFGYSSETGPSKLAKLAVKFAHRNQLSGRDLFEGDEPTYKMALETYPWLSDALEGLACAPSSLNKQPVRIYLNKDGEIAARTLPGDEKSSIDLGIGKFNFAEVAPGEWEWGENAPFLTLS